MTLSTLTFNINIPGSTIDQVTLADSTNTWGIKRDSDADVIVAPGTSVTQVFNSGGQAEFEYQTTLLDSALAYTAYWKILYTVASVQLTLYATTPVPARISIRSLTYLRRQLSMALGGFGKYTALPSSSNTVIASSELIGAEDDHTSFNNTWVYIASGAPQGELRRVLSESYDSSAGSIQTTRPFSSNPASGSVFEIHSRLPAKAMNRLPGLDDILNLALASLWTIQRVDFPESGTESFFLTDEWLINETQVIEVYRPSSAGFRPYQVGATYKFKYNAESPFLEGVQNSEVGWQMDVIRPANTWINVSGVWQASTTGLVNESDECLFVPQVVIPVALFFAYEALSTSPWYSETERLRFAAKAIDQARVAWPIKNDYTPKVDKSPAASSSTNAPRFGMKGLLGW